MGALLVFFGLYGLFGRFAAIYLFSLRTGKKFVDCARDAGVLRQFSFLEKLIWFMSYSAFIFMAAILTIR